MKVFYDLEFLENGHTVDLISIGALREDGKEFYRIDSDAPWERIRKHKLLSRNVLPHLPYVQPEKSQGMKPHEISEWFRNDWQPDLSDRHYMPAWVIRNQLREFFESAGEPIELWGYCSAYNHVALMQLWGSMVKRPPFLPTYTNDVRQLCHMFGVNDETLTPGFLKERGFIPKCGKPHTTHSALHDAQHVKGIHDYIRYRFAVGVEDGEADPPKAIPVSVAPVDVNSRTVRRIRPGRRGIDSGAVEVHGFNDLLLGEAVGQALGAASMCWNPRPTDQVFDSSRASAIYDALISRIQKELTDAISVRDQLRDLDREEVKNGQRQGRSEGLRVPEQALGVSGDTAEGRQQGNGGSDSERGPDQGAADQDGQEGRTDPKASAIVCKCPQELCQHNDESQPVDEPKANHPFTWIGSSSLDRCVHLVQSPVASSFGSFSDCGLPREAHPS